MKDAIRHLELEEDWLEANKPNTDLYVASFSSHSSSNKKRKFTGAYQQNKGKEMASAHKKQKFYRHGKGKFPPKKKKNMKRVKCYNYGKRGHFVRDCIESKKVQTLKHICK